jgi:hypothetical protein
MPVRGMSTVLLLAVGLRKVQVLHGLGEGVRPPVRRWVRDHGRHLLSSFTLDSPKRPEVAFLEPVHPIE